MNKKRMMKRVFAVLLAFVLVITGVNIPKLTPRAAEVTEIDLSPYITMSGTTAGAVDNGQGLGIMITEILFSMPSHLDSKDEWAANNANSLIIDISITNFSGADGKNPGVMPMFMSNSWVWNQGTYGDLATTTDFQLTMDIASLDWGSSNSISKFGLQFANLVEGSTVTYTINSVKFSSETVSSGDSGNSGESGTVTIPSGNLIDYNYDDIDYNYAKLLQYSLYFYDANMCGDEVGEKSLQNWRDDCHTYDKYNYTRSDGTVANVDLTGGFHDAGDHVKFGLPEAYAAFTLGMSYDTNKSAYQAAKQEEHLETITTHFADYLVDCTVLNASGTAVEAFCVQVGNGGGGYDHGYWGAPENQPQNNRTAYFSSASAPHTDIVSLSAAALAMQYKNFGGDEYLDTAKLLFAYAKNNSKSVGTTAGEFYTSSNWEDDYCLAALLLYKITGDSTYQTEYNNYKSIDASMKPYWPLGWDNVGPAVAYYDNNTSKLATLMAISDGNSTYGGYRCVSNWGSARYNTSMQYTGLMYDKLTNTDTYRSWAEGQMKYLLGNNSAKQCYVAGYNDYGPKYPHHRAASGYTGGDQGTKTQANVLLGALVGGQKIDGTYTDSASDYVCNEVAIDYNATLVAAAAAIYDKYTTDTTNQFVDNDYHVDSNNGSVVEPGETVNLSITGTFDYNQAYEILRLTNEERAKQGLSPLTMDKDLLDAAMIRAAETAINFDHTRPNGEQWRSLCSKMYGENIAVNSANAAAAMSQWMNSTSGHKEAILNESYKSLGVGVFYQDGYMFYVQCFGLDNATAVTQPSNVNKTIDVEILKSSLNNATLAFDSTSYMLEPNTTRTTSVKMTNLDWDPARVKLDSSNFTYSLNPTGVATIEDGVITPKANGTTTLTAKLNSLTSKQVTGIVTVSGFVESVTLDKSTLKLEMDGTTTATFVATVSPSTATDKTVSWESSNTSVATVSTSGVVTAVAPGTATITVTTNSGSKTATCNVEVWGTHPTPGKPELGAYGPYSINLVSKSGYLYRIEGGEWTSSYEFKNLKPNTEYTFYQKRAASGYYYESASSEGATFKTQPVNASSVVLDKTELEFEIGGANEVTTATLNATVSPSDASYKTVTWTTSNDKVATVDSTGKVTAVGPGEATITAKINEGANKPSATCTVTVWKTPDVPTQTPSTSTTPTKDTITLTPYEGCEYRIAPDGQWQDSNIFTGLEPGTEYTFEIRVKGDEDNNVHPGEVVTIKVSTGNTGGTTGGDTGNSGGTAGGNTGNDGNDAGTAIPFVAPDIKVSYRTHIQTFGWEGKADDIKTWKANGAMSGTSGLAKRLEGINIVVAPTTTCEDLDLGIQYTTHCQSYGWLPWSADGDMNGTEGEAKRLEAIMIQLTGEHADYYDVYYRVHAQSYGWLGWAKNGEPSGTAGYAKRLEGIQIVVVKKGDSFDKNMGGITSKNSKPFEAKAGSSPIVNYPATSNTAPVVPGEDMVNVAYRTHVQSFGWQGWKYNGQMSGTSGLAKRLEGIEINLTNKDYDGGIAYATHVQTYGWQGADLNKPSTWKHDGQMAGTSGEAKRLEAICITLTGDMAEHYDIYYRVHAQSYGWLGWAKNGAPAGTAGYAKRLEGIQIVIVPKNSGAPGKTYMGVTSVKDQAYVEK